MKFRTFINSLKESFKNIVRHPLVALASITTIGLMLTLMGSFVAISLNANHIAEAVGTKPPVEIWVKLGASEADIEQIDQALKSNPLVASYQLLTPEENFELLKSEMGSESSVLDNFDGNNLLPHLFQVRLLDPQQTEAFERQMVVYQGVNRVDYSAKVMSSLSRLIHWVNLGTLVAFVVMGVIALFIISNMVRISTLARGEEISIMKYVGATNTYIRLPYILEGAITGLIGAVIAIAVVYFGYRAGYAHLMANTSANSFYALLPLNSILYNVVVVDLGLGILIGAIGSFFSVRRYIKV